MIKIESRNLALLFLKHWNIVLPPPAGPVFQDCTIILGLPRVTIDCFPFVLFPELEFIVIKSPGSRPWIVPSLKSRVQALNFFSQYSQTPGKNLKIFHRAYFLSGFLSGFKNPYLSQDFCCAFICSMMLLHATTPPPLKLF